MVEDLYLLFLELLFWYIAAEWISLGMYSYDNMQLFYLRNSYLKSKLNVICDKNLAIRKRATQQEEAYLICKRRLYQLILR